jgi:hypothetical protein
LTNPDQAREEEDGSNDTPRNDHEWHYARRETPVFAANRAVSVGWTSVAE